MSYPQITEEPLFTEAEASRRLGISLQRLHRVLDENLFNNERMPPCRMRVPQLGSGPAGVLASHLTQP